MFHKVQLAYRCLSNPEERGWYDIHRDQIINGKQVSKDDLEANCDYMTKTKLSKYFESDVFEGFKPSLFRKDFFSVYGDLF